MDTKKIVWTSKDGSHKLEAWVEIGIGGVAWCANLDGKSEGQVYEPSRAIPTEACKAGIVAAIGRVALSAERYALLDAEAQKLAIEYAASPAALRAQRDNLVDALRGALDGVEEARESAFESDCPRGLPGHDAPEVGAARKALADFDAAHPEIVAAIETEKEAATERNRWN